MKTKETTTKDKQRIFNFLIDDLIKLKKDIKENNKEEINIFFSYWSQHIEQLNYFGLNTNFNTLNK
tara:strand:- start:191 stop:388 length:198 start_codon:yes stop_codon:yes gene_type:complete